VGLDAPHSNLDGSKWGLDKTSMGFDKCLDGTSMGPDGPRQEPRWASIETSIGLDGAMGLDRASMAVDKGLVGFQ
jgi:hypothetical protein